MKYSFLLFCFKILDFQDIAGIVMADKREREEDPAEEEEEWIGPMPTEAAKPKKRKGKHSSA